MPAVCRQGKATGVAASRRGVLRLETGGGFWQTRASRQSQLPLAAGDGIKTDISKARAQAAPTRST